MTTKSAPNSLAIHQFIGLTSGPKLIVFGAVHGNEVCGTLAIQRVRQELEQGQIELLCGTLSLLPVANPLAYQLGQRNGERNLNRSMRISQHPQDYEDRISNALCPLLQAHDVLLDLHSSHTPGLPFALIGPRDNDGSLEPFTKAKQEEALALALNVSRIVDGWLETYAQGVSNRQSRGTKGDVEYGVGTTEVMRRLGGMAITLECGQHDDELAHEVAYNAIINTLVHLKMIKKPQAGGDTSPEVMQLYSVVDKHHVDDVFTKNWQDFDKLQQGEVIAHRHDGAELKAEKDSWILFPNPDAEVEQEWFYLAEASDRF